MKLVVITPENNAPDETVVVNKLFGAGLEFLHFRKPTFSTSEYRNYIETIDTPYRSRIVIHDCYELFTEMKLGGIHLNSFSRNNREIWNAIEEIAPAAISTSFHSWEEIENNDFAYGSVFISPVFDSISKPGYMGSISIPDIIDVRRALNSKQKYCPQIIGLGGVDKNGIPILGKYGFDGAALLGAIWNAADPVAAFKEIKAATE